MTNDIPIPPEAVQAAAYQVCKGAGDDFVCKVMCDGCKDVARQALIDALHAWPGMIGHGDLVPGENGPPLHIRNAIILPTENTNAEG